MSVEGDITLCSALEDQSTQWFETAADLTCAANAIKREMETGHLYIEPRLDPSQITQRKQILSIAHAVIEAARKRALENFHGSLLTRDSIKCQPVEGQTMQDGSAKSPENSRTNSSDSIQAEPPCSESLSGQSSTP